MNLAEHPLAGLPVRPAGPSTARIMVVGDMPSAHDLTTGRPFSGSAGHELEKMLTEAGISISECFLTNICATPAPENELEHFTHSRKHEDRAGWVARDGRWLSPEVLSGLERLESQISLVRPRVIIALGNLALWALCRQWGVGSWRGSTLEFRGDPSITVVPTHHPSVIFKNWPWRIFCTFLTRPS